MAKPRGQAPTSAAQLREAAAPRNRHGFTLLELLLALALTGLVLFVISMAVDVNMRAFHKRRATIEQTQLARTLLRIIADDIRASVSLYEQDLAGVEKLLADAAEGAADDALAGAGLDDDLDLDVDALLGEEASNTTDLAAGETLPTTPGIYGNQYELQIDVSRLPRIDEYQQLLAVDPAVAMLDLPSDVKTVTYFVQDQGLAAPAALDGPVPELGVTAEESGLVRRQMDRSVTQWALENGNMTGMQQSGEVIAPEVVGLELSYFDGYEWRTEWDSGVEGTLPVAIQLVLIMKPPEDPTTAADPVLDESSLKYYRLVVRVPTGKPVEEQEEEETDTEETDSTEAV